MYGLLPRLFIRDYTNVSDTKVREHYGVLSGAVGIFINILLGALKIAVGIITNSIAITADAVNNLSDAGSSGINLLGFKLANKPADKGHPYGHGRIEYISGLIVSFIVLLFGIEFLKTSVSRIIHPEAVKFSIPVVIILTLTIFAKIWLAFFYKSIGKAIHSKTMSAVAMDSISDCGATAVTILSLVLSKFTSFNADGYFGTLVAVIIIIAGINLIKDTIDPLLGQPPEQELVDEIEKEVLSYDGVVGIHDLVIHNYGPSRIFGSLHVEMPSSFDAMVAHDTIDTIERDLSTKFKINFSIHYDPIITDNAFVNEKKAFARDILKDIDSRISMHDFRIVAGPTHTNFIFDIVLPYDCKITENQVVKKINEMFQNSDKSYFAVITVDRAYNGN
ncbi:Ferrous-iron efflux pump FieF [bioreactor metagenome]|uniref:Ferrous-iron efflux pump FieF n=1 Tax=bioreactor metagenome TaxID=1076179 RepID=A0A645AMS7_9ZZZZ